MAARLARVLLVAFLGAAPLVVGCSEDAEDDDSDDSGNERWTCNNIIDGSWCIEVEGDEETIELYRDGCLGAWSMEPCPLGPNLIGCCSYTYDTDYLDCYYEPTLADPLLRCAESMGSWTPGSR